MNTFHVPLSAMRLLLSLFLVALLAGCDASAPASDALAVRFLVDGQANITYQAADDVSTARADGRWETRLTAGPDDVLSLDAVSTDGQPVTTTIEIDGRVVATHQESSTICTSSLAITTWPVRLTALAPSRGGMTISGMVRLARFFKTWAIKPGTTAAMISIAMPRSSRA